MRHPIATITMQNGANIQIELFPAVAPNSVTSFIWVAEQGLYNGRTVERVVQDYLIQPSYDGFGHDPACEFFLPGEFAVNGFAEPHPTFKKWTVGLAGDGACYTSGSEFFILMGDYREKLDGRFPVIGRVVVGFEELERLQAVETEPVEIEEDAVVRRPIRPEVMEKVEVETWGVAYPEPVRLLLDQAE